MACYKKTSGCGVYENRSCNECPYSRPPKPKCDTCAFSCSCALKDTNLTPDCGYYAEEDDNMKRIKQLIKIIDELYAREYSFNYMMEGTWNELCDEAIQYLNELKIKN